MGDFTVLRAVTDTLKSILELGITLSPDPQLSGIGIDLRSPKEMREANVGGISLWLYRVARDADLLNCQPERLSPRADAGVVGYVPNTASVDDLISLVGQIRRGEQSCPSHISGCLLRRVAAGARGLANAEPNPASSALTPREMEIFRLVGAGLSNKDIARRLCISVGTTKTHVHSVLGKAQPEAPRRGDFANGHQSAIEAQQSAIQAAALSSKLHPRQMPAAEF